MDELQEELESNRYSFYNVDEAFSYNKEELIGEFKLIIGHNVRLINEVLNTNMDELTDEEFWNYAKHTFEISFEEKHYLKMLSLWKNINFTKFIDIKTSVPYLVNDPKYKCCYLVAVSDGLELDCEKVYSLSEIKEFIANNRIVLIGEDIWIDEFSSSLEEKNQEFSFPILNLGMGTGTISEDSELFPYAIKIAREELPKKVILKRINREIEDLKNEIDIFFRHYCNPEEAKICQAWYEESGMKLVLQNLKVKK